MKNNTDMFMNIKRDHFKVRTDLALELNEEVNGGEGRYNGVIVHENIDEDTKIKVTTLEITNAHGVRVLGRAMGTYITIEAERLSNCDTQYSQKISEIVTFYIKKLLNNMVTDISKCSILVAGLGNRQVTADSLGPFVVENLDINRHFHDKHKLSVAGISPGVMAQTGIETAQIIKGIADESEPDAVIVLDSLAARDSKRLNTTIQLSDRGINPGSGVGNHRVGITRENIGVPVLAIGVPTVIDAPTIVNDTMENLMKLLSGVKELESVADVLGEYTPAEKYHLIKEVINPEMSDMYVTPKDIDENIRVIGYILAEAINKLNISCSE